MKVVPFIAIIALKLAVQVQSLPVDVNRCGPNGNCPEEQPEHLALGGSGESCTFEDCKAECSSKGFWKGYCKGGTCSCYYRMKNRIHKPQIAPGFSDGPPRPWKDAPVENPPCQYSRCLGNCKRSGFEKGVCRDHMTCRCYNGPSVPMYSAPCTTKECKETCLNRRFLKGACENEVCTCRDSSTMDDLSGARKLIPMKFCETVTCAKKCIKFGFEESRCESNVICHCIESELRFQKCKRELCSKNCDEKGFSKSFCARNMCICNDPRPGVNRVSASSFPVQEGGMQMVYCETINGEHKCSMNNEQLDDLKALCSELETGDEKTTKTPIIRKRNNKTPDRKPEIQTVDGPTSVYAENETTRNPKAKLGCKGFKSYIDLKIPDCCFFCLKKRCSFLLVKDTCQCIDPYGRDVLPRDLLNKKLERRKKQWAKHHPGATPAIKYENLTKEEECDTLTFLYTAPMRSKTMACTFFCLLHDCSYNLIKGTGCQCLHPGEKTNKTTGDPPRMQINRDDTTTNDQEEKATRKHDPYKNLTEYLETGDRGPRFKKAFRLNERCNTIDCERTCLPGRFVSGFCEGDSCKCYDPEAVVPPETILDSWEDVSAEIPPCTNDQCVVQCKGIGFEKGACLDDNKCHCYILEPSKPRNPWQCNNEECNQVCLKNGFLKRTCAGICTCWDLVPPDSLSTRNRTWLIIPMNFCKEDAPQDCISKCNENDFQNGLCIDDKSCHCVGPKLTVPVRLAFKGGCTVKRCLEICDREGLSKGVCDGELCLCSEQDPEVSPSYGGMTGSWTHSSFLYCNDKVCASYCSHIEFKRGLCADSLTCHCYGFVGKTITVHSATGNKCSKSTEFVGISTCRFFCQVDGCSYKVTDSQEDSSRKVCRCVPAESILPVGRDVPSDANITRTNFKKHQ